MVRRLFVILTTLLCTVSSTHAADVEKWHALELVFTDSAASYAESDQNPNPFLDRRLTCTFTAPGGGDTYTVQGYFNTDNAGGTSGSRFVCRFSPNVVGTWQYSASFRAGSDVAISLNPTAGIERNLAEPKSGSFTVEASTRSLPDFRHESLGWLQNPGSHHFKHAGSGAHVLKIGLNIGEGFLGYEGFDNTQRVCSFDPTKPSEVKDYASHLSDWQSGDPNWSCGDGCLHSNPSNAGKEIIGAVNYIASSGANSKYLLLLNVPGGDTCDTYPYLDATMSAESKRHFDTSKLNQWGVLFEHMTHKGLIIHAQLGEVEIETHLDGNERTCSGSSGNCIGPHRKLYYREMVARFGHNPGMIWNLGEENGYSEAARRDFVAYLHAINPYDQPVTSHTKNKDNGSDTDIEDHYDPLLGDSNFEATSIQMSPVDGEWDGIRNEVLRWRTDSLAAGEPWIVAMDEIPRSADYNSPFETNRARKRHQWQTLMAGGHYEWYLTLDNSQSPHTGWSEHGLDPWINDFRLVDEVLGWIGVAHGIFARVPSLKDLEPVATNSVLDATGSSDTWTLADPGVAYVSYDRAGGAFTFDGAAGDYTVEFIDPDSGASCSGTPSVVSGGSPTPLGSCSCCAEDAAVVLVREGLGPSTTTTTTTTTTTLPSLCASSPESGCRGSEPGRSSLAIKISSKPSRSKIKWVWKRGDATTVADFGDVFSPTTSYRFCLYDSSALAQPLLEDAPVTTQACAGASCWKTTGSISQQSGYKYNDSKSPRESTRRLKLKAGEQGFAGAVFKLKGGGAADLVLPLEPSLTAQLLVIDDGGAMRCWETPFSELQTATSSKLKARGP